MSFPAIRRSEVNPRAPAALIWRFLDSGLGMPWISLDSFVRIVTFQWVIAIQEKNQRINQRIIFAFGVVQGHQGHISIVRAWTRKLAGRAAQGRGRFGTGQGAVSIAVLRTYREHASERLSRKIVGASVCIPD